MRTLRVCIPAVRLVVVVTRVDEIMLTDPLPLLPPGSTLQRAVVVLAEQRGIILVADDDRRLHGVLTAGDLTRLMEHEMDVCAARRTHHDLHAAQLSQAARERRGVSHGSFGIMAMPCSTAERLVGVVHYDLLRAGA